MYTWSGAVLRYKIRAPVISWRNDCWGVEIKLANFFLFHQQCSCFTWLIATAMIKFKAVFSGFTIGASLSRPSRPSPTRLLLFAWKCSIYERKNCANKFEREIFTRVLFDGELTTVFGGIIARAFWLCVECETAFHSSFVKWQPIVGELSTPNCRELSVVMLVLSHFSKPSRILSCRNSPAESLALVDWRCVVVGGVVLLRLCKR